MQSSFRMAPMFIIMGAIFFLSHQPGDTLKLPLIPGIDKVAHFIAYAVLAATVIFAHKKESWFNAPKRVSIITILVTLCYGVSDEYHQSFIAGRYSSVGDVIADTLGGVAVVIVFLHHRKRVSRLQS